MAELKYLQQTGNRNANNAPSLLNIQPVNAEQIQDMAVSLRRL
jgi:hypothetical protein